MGSGDVVGLRATVGVGGGLRLKKWIIMHVWDGFSQKVHYNELFGGGRKMRNSAERRGAESAEKDLS